MRGTTCERLLAAALPDLLLRLRRFGELDTDDVTATKLLKIAPDTRVVTAEENSVSRWM